MNLLPLIIEELVPAPRAWKIRADPELFSKLLLSIFMFWVKPFVFTSNAILKELRNEEFSTEILRESLISREVPLEARNVRFVNFRSPEELMTARGGQTNP